MNTNAMDAVLDVLRATAAQAGVEKTQKPGASGGPGFAESLREAVDAIDTSQQKAQQLENAKAAGSPVDVSQVMVALEKADLSFQAMVEVRNKLVSAYQEIMNLQI